MICAYCGTDLPEAAMFCGECGRAVVAKVATKSRSRVSSAAVTPSTRWPSAVAEHNAQSRPSFAEEPGAFEIDLLAPATPTISSDAGSAPELVEPSFAAGALDSAAAEHPAPEPTAVDDFGTDSAVPGHEWHSVEAPTGPDASGDAIADVDPLWELPGAPLTQDPSPQLTFAPPAESLPPTVVSATPLSMPVPPSTSVLPPMPVPPSMPVSPSGPVPQSGPDDVQEFVDRVRTEERCTQCGAELAASDIFCGECGFVRRAADVAPPRPRDTAAYDPFPWGLPREEVAVAPAAVAAAPIVSPEPEVLPPVAPPAAAPTTVADAPADDFDSDVEKTRIVDRAARGDTFVLQFSTGENVTVSGSGLIGRNPLAEPGEYFDSLVAIIDPGKSVSKTHLEFGQESGAFWISDRYSANGTVVREPDRPARRGEAGKRYRVVRGTRIDIGEQFFIVS